MFVYSYVVTSLFLVSKNVLVSYKNLTHAA